MCGCMQALLKEYVVSGDVAEAAECLRSLDAPHYHHEFVKRALLAAFEAPDRASALLSLLAALASTGQVSQAPFRTRMLMHHAIIVMVTPHRRKSHAWRFSVA